ncbi:MAG: hypothetical protein HY855_19400, partial [Burkholderiales bacterium]|nr:hypothetical protein [Burkholderiales bacterium]
MSHPVPWAQVQRRFTLMAQGLAGRTLDLGPLPAEMAQFTTAHENLAAWRVLVLRRLGRIEAAALLPGADGRAWPRLLSGLFGWLETLRIDAALIRRYPGAAADLARVRAATLVRLGAGAAPAGPVLAALLRLRRHALGAPLA